MARRLDEMLRKVHGKWALVSRRDPSRVLQYYHGLHDQKPSAAWASKVERRVHAAQAQGRSQLNELFDKPLPVKWHSIRNGQRGDFVLTVTDPSTGKETVHDYELEIYYSDEYNIDQNIIISPTRMNSFIRQHKKQGLIVSFSRWINDNHNEYDLTGDLGPAAAQVLATVIHHVVRFVKDTNTTWITFTGSGESRRKLYQLLAKRVSAQMGWVSRQCRIGDSDTAQFMAWTPALDHEYWQGCSSIVQPIPGTAQFESHVHVEESINTAYPWTWQYQEPRMYTANFTTRDNDTIEFKAYRDLLGTNRSWEIYFDANRSYELTKRNDARRILATIVDIMLDLVRQTNIDIMYFTAMEPNRFRVYHQLAKKFSNRTDYQVITERKLLRKIDPTLASEGVIAVCKPAVLQSIGTVMESFDSTYSWQWTQQEVYCWKTEFTTRNHDVIRFMAFDETHYGMPNTWSIEFKSNGAYELTHMHDIQVLSTIISIARSFVQAKTPELLVFTATHRRIKLYMRIIDRLINDFEYVQVHDRHILKHLQLDDQSTVVLAHEPVYRQLLDTVALLESREHTHEWHWASSAEKNLVAEFCTEDHGTVQVHFDRTIELRDGVNVPTWRINFLRDGHQHIASRGNAAIMFDTISSILDAFVGRFEHAPMHLAFVAYEPAKRELYRQLVETFAENNGYSIEIAGAHQFNLDQQD